MNLTTLIEALSNRRAYPYPVERIEVRQTHLSIVFLAGPFVYKIKKPVQFSFADFSTLDKRRYFCDQEVKLNRRLAPAVYLGVVPIVMNDAGLFFEKEGSPVEWAVKMERLPDEATLKWRVIHDDLSTDLIERITRRIARFHAETESTPATAALGRFEVVAGNARGNLIAARIQLGQTISPEVLNRLTTLTDDRLDQLKALIEQRAARGIPRDTHGDLRLEHVYYFPDRAPPSDLAIIDCIEFNERFRFADPIADLAFLAMDLIAHGRRDLAHDFAREYFRASGDNEGRSLLPFYVSYRAAVRAKVNGIKASESEVPERERLETRQRARAHWLHALFELEEPGRRPCLILTAGLPGTGKSTLAKHLVERARAVVIRTDVVRKGLAHEAGIVTPENIYDRAWTERTYAECLKRAEACLFRGERAIVDGNFREESRRQDFLALARRWGIPCRILVCRAAPEVVQARLANRTGDASDADWQVYRKVEQLWEPPSSGTRSAIQELRTDGDIESVVNEALTDLQSVGLM